MKEKFKERLQKLVNDFDYAEFMELSKDMHRYECRGGKISHHEDELWEELTAKSFEWEDQHEQVS